MPVGIVPARTAAELVKASRDRYLAQYVDPSKHWNLALGQMSRILEKCAGKSVKDPLLRAMAEFVRLQCPDPDFWFRRLPRELDGIVGLRNGAAHKSAISESKFEEFRNLALGLQGTSPICEIVSEAPRAED